ncbi:MAG: lytic transglycosylase domain-containing protein [Clostridiales bacterium]|nr:lytic transglycosylase domain-containing protein [Clostridiales bacterium]
MKKDINKILWILIIILSVLIIAVTVTLIVYYSTDRTPDSKYYRQDECINKYSDIITKYSIKYKVDENLIKAMIMAESSFNKDAVSKSGAIGLMQMMPSTYNDLKEKLGFTLPPEEALKDPETNIACGVYYYATYCSVVGGTNASLAAYNCGPNRVRSWMTELGGEVDIAVEDIPIESVKTYVKRIMKYYNSYCLYYGEAPDYDSVLLPRETALEYAKKYGQKYKVDYNLIMAIIETESSFYCYRTSKTGAIGLMQIMPDTFSVDIAQNLNLEDNPDQLYDPEFNIMCGAYLLHWLDYRLDGINEISISYHVGVTQIKSWLEDDNYSENGRLITDKLPEEAQNYLFKVMGHYRRSIRLDGEDKGYKFD